MDVAQTPIAAGPLLEIHQRAGATIETLDGWHCAVRYPQQPSAGDNALIDMSHNCTFELNGPNTGANLHSLCGKDIAPRNIHIQKTLQAYRLSSHRAILIGYPIPPEAVDVTGGWSSLALLGPNAEAILNKVTALDLRQETLPILGCCMGPMFGVNTLFGRFDDRFEMHICPDSAQFIWEVLLDAGAEYRLKPAGLELLP